MCTQCDPHRPGYEDTRSTTVEDAERFERDRAEARGWPDDDRPEPYEDLS
jgi:hypothetical protein